MYEQDKQYTLKYLDGDGKEQTMELTPEKDMSIPQVITYIKEKDNNFFKLIENKKLKKEGNMMEEVKTLYDLLNEVENGVDINDVAYDMVVFVDFEKDSSDPFDVFVSNLCKDLHCVRYSDTAATVDLYKWVESHFDILDELFDTSASDKEGEEEELICEIMPGLFSGYVSDSTYNELNTKLGYNKLSESEKVEEGKRTYFDAKDYAGKTLDALINIENKATLDDMKKVASEEFLEEITSAEEFWRFLLGESNDEIVNISNKYFSNDWEELEEEAKQLNEVEKQVTEDIVEYKFTAEDVEFIQNLVGDAIIVNIDENDNNVLQISAPETEYINGGMINMTDTFVNKVSEYIKSKYSDAELNAINRNTTLILNTQRA